MTELEAFLAMLDRTKIDYAKTVYADHIEVEVQNSSDKGYSGFVSEWDFTLDGQLVCVAHWE